MMLVRLHISTVTKKATLPVTTPSQKTSISLGNLCTSD